MQNADETRDPKHLYERWIVRDDNGAPVGFGILFALWWSAVPDQYVFDFTTIPERRGEGAATRFYDMALTRLTTLGYRTLIAQTREDVIAGMEFLEHRGFHAKLRKLESVLQLDNFDRKHFVGVEARMAAQGIVITSLPLVQQRDPNWLQNLWELDWPLTQDVPSFTQRTRPTLEEFTQLFQQPDFLPNGFAVAIDTSTGEYVGMSQVYQSKASPQQWETGRTGVLRAYRRRGIATALKLALIDDALQRGIDTIRTRNADGNPMYTLNRRLGFQPLPAWVTYEKIAE